LWRLEMGTISGGIMTLQRSRVEDVLAVLREVVAYNRGLPGQRVDSARREAVVTVAESELRRHRFANRNSALKSIHDACARRLKPIIDGIHELMLRWKSGCMAIQRS
jgi:hypothetical protein